MPSMDEKHIAQFESKLERLVEGAFIGVFGRRLNAHDIAVKLARSMENALRYDTGDDLRPVAPDTYIIYLHPDVQAQLIKWRPSLTTTLRDHLIDLAGQTGYRLIDKPLVKILADPTLTPADLTIHADHSALSENSTAAMQHIPKETAKAITNNPHLIINGTRNIKLIDPIINIGRSSENHIVIDDPFLSRHHLQMRLRSGTYILFDVHSRGGTFVNDVRVTQHRLQAGDVIRAGETRIVYVADEKPNIRATGTTDSLNPVD